MPLLFDRSSPPVLLFLFLSGTHFFNSLFHLQPNLATPPGLQRRACVCVCSQLHVWVGVCLSRFLHFLHMWSNHMTEKMAPKNTAEVLHSANQLCNFVIFCVFCVTYYYFLLIVYIMLLLPSLMTENSFWTSETRLLTADWNKLFPLTNPTRRISCFHWNRPRSTPFAWRKEAGKGGLISGILLRSWRPASKRPMPSILLASVQLLENKIDDLLLRLSYQRDIKTVKSYVSLRRCWTKKQTI